MSTVTDPSHQRLYVSPSYWERFSERLAWAMALCAAIGLIRGLSAGRSGVAVITYTSSAVVTQVLIGAPLLTLVLAVFPSKGRTTESETRTWGD